MRYSSEFKEQVLSEVKESKNIIAVARKHKMPDSTIHAWLNKKHKSKSSTETYLEVRKLKQELKDSKLELMILKDLLKKTYKN